MKNNLWDHKKMAYKIKVKCQGHGQFISSLFMSIELNEREGYQRLSLSRVLAHDKVRPQHQKLCALLFLNNAWALLCPAEL